MLRVFILTVSFMGFLTLSSAQQVGSFPYRLMLKTLLSHSVPEIGVGDIDTTANGSVFLDAREQHEYEVSHIAGARWIGYDSFALESVADLDPSSTLIVYCSVGYRSEKIAEQLRSAGFPEVYNLYGGLFEWKNQGRPVYNSKGITDSVHAYSRTWGVWLTDEAIRVYE